MKKKILVLFAQEWDLAELSRPEYRREFEFFFEGFDLFRFPDNARLLTFNARRFIHRLIRKYRRAGLQGVISSNEQFGALIAAEVARMLGLPGTDPHAIVLAQHKYYGRRAQQEIAPEATPRFFAFPYDLDDPARLELPFPFFVKPVKATFSVLAKRVENFGELRRHLSFAPFEELIIRKLVQPFNDLAVSRNGFRLDAHHIVGEEVLDGVQVNVDGFACRGRVRVLGIIDEVMYPGTQHFLRFEYPSRLPTDVQARIADLTVRLMEGIGFDHGFFNLELMVQPESGALKIIEVNPRLASQLADLYHRVDGIRPFRMLLELATGVEPVWRPGAGRFKAAASFVFRRFDGTSPRLRPSRAQRQWLKEQFPDAQLFFYLKRGASLAREMKWLGSHRYATLNLGGEDRQDLEQRYRKVCRQFALEAH
ncbi:MAG TPA: ATP-grasp domain-containing protein [Burkholderiales bacterium]|nr:ATP-grasp domain-containing protein [Burkholderiales bacterium]